ncbi:hypothetical protein BBW65_02135 [Helicobacter enhydrae]|uniref:Cytochrome c domain-containing protein n=1 Tax=Helicobacter enhydrae TaxID=222136 RepID=A0A1B1U7H3_9HELI|nr:hypothetical protein BBW65_02135 [Helicobacter enhydrae]
MRTFGLSIVFCGLAFAQAQYADSVKMLYADAKSTKVIGKLLPTAEVNVIRIEGNRVLLSIEGYTAGDTLLGVYFVPNKRILNAGFVKGAGVKVEKLGTQEVDGKVYNKVKIEAWSENDGLSNNLNALFAKGKELYEQNCSMCHGLHPVKEFTANQWPSMFKAMAGRTGIDKKDYHLVIEYLQKNAKDMNTNTEATK